MADQCRAGPRIESSSVSLTTLACRGSGSTRCAMPSRRRCWQMEKTSPTSRSCSAIATSRPRRTSTGTSGIRQVGGQPIEWTGPCGGLGEINWGQNWGQAAQTKALGGDSEGCFVQHSESLVPTSLSAVPSVPGGPSQLGSELGSSRAAGRRGPVVLSPPSTTPQGPAPAVFALTGPVTGWLRTSRRSVGLRATGPWCVDRR